MVSQDQLLLCFRRTMRQDDNDVQIQGPDFPFHGLSSKSHSATAGVGTACERRSPNAEQWPSWTLHGPASWTVE